MGQLPPPELKIKEFRIKLLREELDKKLKFFHIAHPFSKPAKEEPARTYEPVMNDGVSST